MKRETVLASAIARSLWQKTGNTEESIVTDKFYIYINTELTSKQLWVLDSKALEHWGSALLCQTGCDTVEESQIETLLSESVDLKVKQPCILSPETHSKSLVFVQEVSACNIVLVIRERLNHGVGSAVWETNPTGVTSDERTLLPGPVKEALRWGPCYGKQSHSSAKVCKYER